ncbi:hypothetical protein JCM8097_005177 [Rhodosporidiobolus ruineniae]
MLSSKRKAPLAPAKTKAKGRAPAPPPSKRPRTAPPQKHSNRPRYDAVSDSGTESSDEDQSDDDDDARKAAMLAMLEAHQAALLGDAVPKASTSRAGGEEAAGGVKEQKSVWDMGMDDLEDEEDEDEDESEDEDEGDDDAEAEQAERKGAAQVVAFVEPGREGPLATNGAPVDKKALRDFKAGKITNLHRKASIADAANVKYVGGKAKAKAKAAAAGKAGAAATPEQAAADAAEETHLNKLDSHLSALTSSLTGTSSASLPDLLRELPLAPTKALKGHTPLPKNAPRLLRKGQNAANLKRAQARDEAAGNAVGSKKGAMGMGREALSLKEKRKLDGTDKRQRGLKGAAGKFGRGQLSLSKQDIRRIGGPGAGKE